MTGSMPTSATARGSVLSSRAKKVNEVPFDKVFVIYGKSGTGKTSLAASFPKTYDAPLYILDILENGITSISLEDRENLVVVPIEAFEELDEVLTDFERGFTLDASNKKIPIKASTIVIDSATQLEHLMKRYLMKADNKDKMNLNLWGQVKTSHDMLWNVAKYISNKLDVYMVIICHEKDDKDEHNPNFNKVVPSLAKSGSESLTAKASFVWYTAIETETKVGAEGKVERAENFITYIGPASYLVTKCRKPKEVSIPQKVKNLTFPRFYKNVMRKIESTIAAGVTKTSTKESVDELSETTDLSSVDTISASPTMIKDGE